MDNEDEWILPPGFISTTGGGMRTHRDGLSEEMKAEIRLLAEWSDNPEVICRAWCKLHCNCSDAAVEQFLPLVEEVLKNGNSP